jgi:SEL1 protein
METGHSAYQSKSYPQALVRYMKAAEMGLEVAQSNAAYMLEQGQAWYDSAVRLQRVLYYLRLAADQGNVKSLLQIGDAYYYGRGATVGLALFTALCCSQNTFNG